MKRRMISILCVLCLVVAMLPPVTASAAAPTTLTVGGTNVLGGGCWTTDGSGKLTATDSTTDYNVKYDSATGTLTLKDATINGTDTIGHVGTGIYAEGDLTIVLEGSSTVTGVQDPNGDSQSIRVSGNLTIQGGGSLTAQGAETSSGSSYGIFVIGSFTQQGGSVTAIGGNINGNYTSTGLYVYGGTVTAQDGTLTATGGDTSGSSYGISMASSSSVTVGSAAVTATGGTGNYSYGLYVNPSSPSVSPSVTLSGSGSLTARSGSGTDTAVGIYLNNIWGSTGSVTVGNGSTLLTNSVILFDNSFEAKPLTPTGDGSWLIYGQSDQPSAVGGTYTLTDDLTIENGNTFTIPAGSTLTVPQGKTLTVNGTLNIANQSSLTGSGSLAGSGAFNLTNPEPVISGSETLTYDGTDHFNEFKLEAPSGSVEVMGQSFTISSSPSLEGWSLGTQEIKNAGTYTLTASNGTTTIEKEVTVKPATISITSATVQDKTYDGGTDATVDTVTFDGLVNGESLTSGTDYTATAAFTDKNAGDSKQATVTVTLTNGNYTFSSNGNTATATAKISPLAVALSWSETTSFTYDGQPHSVTATLDNAVANDDVSLDYGTSVTEAIRAGNYTAKVTGLSGRDANNYTLDGVSNDTQAWSIAKATPAYTVPTDLTATYGDTLADVTLPDDWSWNDPDTTSVGNVGSNTFSATYTPSDTTNYNTVTKNLTVAVSAKGITNAVITLGDALTYTGQQQTQQIASVTVDGMAVTTYEISGNTGTDAGAYTLTVTGTGNFTGEATQEWSIAKATYNGATDVSGTVLANRPDKVTLPGLPDGASYGEPSSNDVTGMSITGGVLHYTGGSGIQANQQYTVTVPVAGATNYNDYQITVTLTGTDKQPQTVTISGQPGSVVYGNSFTLSASAPGSGAVSWSASGCASVDASGKVTINGTGTFTVTATVAEDDTYTAGTGRITMTAGKKALTITAENKSAYVGDSAPALTYTVTGLVGSDTLTTAPTLSYASTPDMSKAGTVQILASGAEAGENYDIQYVSGTLTVTTRPSSSGGTTTPSGPSTGSSDGWSQIEKELEQSAPGSTVTVDMNGTTKVPAEVFEAVAGKDVTLELDMGGGVKWEINGQDIPTDLDFTDLDLGVSLNTSDIPVDVINMVTGEKSTVQLSLAHDGEFGFTMTLTAPVGTQNKGLWANLYHYDTTRKQMLFETAAQVDSSGNVALKFTHASEYAIVLDESSHELPFTDTAKGAWYQGAVEYVYRNSIMTGTSATTFEPNTTLSRAMVAQILYNLEGQPTVTGESTFTDSNTHWAAKAIAWAQQTGVVNGYEDNTFRPNRAVSREELAQMLYNYAKVKGYDLTASGDLTAFPDGSKVSSWAEAAMVWANGNELINGHDDGTLQPGGDSTRAQAASILMNFDVNLAN